MKVKGYSDSLNHKKPHTIPDRLCTVWDANPVVFNMIVLDHGFFDDNVAVSKPSEFLGLLV